MIKRFYCLRSKKSDGSFVNNDPFLANNFEDAKKIVKRHLLTEAIGFMMDDELFDNFMDYIKSLSLCDLGGIFDSDTSVHEVILTLDYCENPVDICSFDIIDEIIKFKSNFGGIYAKEIS